MKNLHILNSYESVDLVRVGADMYESVIKWYLFGLFVLCGLIAVSVVCLYFFALYLDRHEFTRCRPHYDTTTSPYQAQVLLNDPRLPTPRQGTNTHCQIPQPTQLDCDTPNSQEAQCPILQHSEIYPEPRQENQLRVRNVS